MLIILSVPEYKRIASFHDCFDFTGNRYDKKASIGNSVPPLFMKAIAEHIKTEILEKMTGQEPVLVEK